MLAYITLQEAQFRLLLRGLSRAVLSICVMSADLLASLQIFDVMQMCEPLCELSKKLLLKNINSCEV